jgi:negative regulator of flagellin synthesis FlgM
MNDAISNYTRMPQSTPALNTSVDKNTQAATAQPAAPASPEAATQATAAVATTVASNVNLSNVAQKALAQPGFDRAKVESIKQAIKNGSYAIDPRRIAQSFVALEQVLPE